MATAGSSLLPIPRYLAIVISAAGMVAAVATIIFTWQTTVETSLSARITATTLNASALLLLAVALLIAWRAGDHPPNVAMALALAFAFSSGPFPMLLRALHVDPRISRAVGVAVFVLGAGFYIRAAQLFPRKLTPSDIASSSTIWARRGPHRAVLLSFLRAPAVWVFVALTTLLVHVARSPTIFEAHRLMIVSIGLIYFYIMYRAGDVETRRKVLWFLEAAVATLVIGLLATGIRAASHEAVSPTLRVVLVVAVDAVNALAQVICVCAAVFYAGAVSPALVIRKTVVYGVTTASLLFAYAIVEAYLVNLLVDLTGFSDRFASALLGTLFGLAFHPIKNRMEHLLRPAGHGHREAEA